MNAIIRTYGGLVVVVVAVVAAVVLGVVVCGWADGFAEVQTEQTERAAIEWCAVCNDYADTHIGIGGVVVCGVCDTILAW